MVRAACFKENTNCLERVIFSGAALVGNSPVVPQNLNTELPWEPVCALLDTSPK